ncbi:LptA/OstA family protein [Synoicihabitans lomoniglobus]|uniref:LptA/OstA family protein n=1 Tax=Synoicihabitans lomoniglobus TaxID=2909285 RepID=A0AAF0CPX6_9BACT|nr:hypothetical protein [Opitutaceae bacterium LMO-M01]WED65886.1 LptA/OstA family protein [Opitutaceae bacterium LMO-M01]
MNFRHLLLFAVGLISALAISAQETVQETVLEADDLVMTSTATETRALCVGNVKLTGTNMSISCDRLEIVAARTGDTDATIGELNGFKFLLATGHVRLVQGDREATCGRAEVLPAEQKVVLYEDPMVIDHSSDFIAAGSQITLYRGQRKLEVKHPKLTGPPIQDLGPEAQKALGETAPDPQN